LREGGGAAGSAGVYTNVIKKARQKKKKGAQRTFFCSGDRR